MGLDMYLEGVEFLCVDFLHPRNNIKVDGFRLKRRELELGYWRKHPDLHGFIVNKFAGGRDDCQDIPLAEGELLTIIAAVKVKQLPKTSGFFFGASDGTEDVETIQTFEKALRWLKKAKKGVWKSINYRASW